jgi:hypothetical protein
MSLTNKSGKVGKLEWDFVGEIMGTECQEMENGSS